MSFSAEDWATLGEELPPVRVVVRDPSGQHRFFRTAREGVRRGRNLLRGQVTGLVVTVEARNYIVVPAWVTLAAAADNILYFPGAAP